MKSLAFLLLAACLVSAAVPDAGPPAPAQSEAATYQIDGVHSTVLFRVRHLGVSNFYGRFNEVGGSFVIGAKPSESSVKIEIRTDSVDTGAEGRDRHLKSPDFFNAVQYPVMSFESTKVTRKESNLYELTGNLSCHGETKPITVEMEKIGERELGGRNGYRAGFEAVFTIQRSEFGMSYGVENDMLGDTVKVFVSVEGQRK